MFHPTIRLVFCFPSQKNSGPLFHILIMVRLSYMIQSNIMWYFCYTAFTVTSGYRCEMYNIKGPYTDSIIPLLYFTWSQRLAKKCFLKRAHMKEISHPKQFSIKAPLLSLFQKYELIFYNLIRPRTCWCLENITKVTQNFMGLLQAQNSRLQRHLGNGVISLMLNRF